MLGFGRWTLLSVLALCGVAFASPGPGEKKVMGWIEYAKLEGGPTLKAKLDPGAKTSSLHAEDITRFKKDGAEWVRFTFRGKDSAAKESVTVTYERPILREIRIKDHEDKSRRRFVVVMSFELGGEPYSSEFSLVDRSKFNYPILLGRLFLKDVALVDSGRTAVLGRPRSKNP